VQHVRWNGEHDTSYAGAIGIAITIADTHADGGAFGPALRVEPE
jgi:hypothetical protein